VRTLIRIDIDDERMRHFTAAYLRSHTGQGMLRRDKSGSVIDHISVSHIQAQGVPLLDHDAIARASDLIREGFDLIEEPRLTLHDAITGYEASLPAVTRTAPAKAGWAVRAAQLHRLDAAYFDPWVAKIRKELLAIGGQAVSTVPAGGCPHQLCVPGVGADGFQRPAAGRRQRQRGRRPARSDRAGRPAVRSG
jgi:hypothetical protein